MPWLIMRAGTVHVPPLSWQNQSSRAESARKQVAVTSRWTACLLMLSCLSAHKCAQTSTLEKHFGETVQNFPFHQNLIDHNSTLTHSAVRSHFLYISANLGGTAANYNSELMNYVVRPHRVLLCPRINLSDFAPTVRMDFLLNDFMRKNYSYKFEANASCYEDLLP